MPSYYFHFQNAQSTTPDALGIELADDYEAGHAGLAGVRTLLAEAIEAREIIDLSSRFRIVDDKGRFVIEIAFTDILTVT